MPHHETVEGRLAKTPAQFDPEMADAIHPASIAVLVAIKSVKFLLRLQRLLQQSIAHFRQSASGTQQSIVRLHQDQYRAGRGSRAEAVPIGLEITRGDRWCSGVSASP